MLLELYNVPTHRKLTPVLVEELFFVLLHACGVVHVGGGQADVQEFHSLRVRALFHPQINIPLAPPHRLKGGRDISSRPSWGKRTTIS